MQDFAFHNTEAEIRHQYIILQNQTIFWRVDGTVEFDVICNFLETREGSSLMYIANSRGPSTGHHCKPSSKDDNERSTLTSIYEEALKSLQ